MAEDDKNLQLRRICLFLEDKDKNKRKEALNSVLTIVLDPKDEDLLEIWEILHKPVVKILNDPVEACRESAIEILRNIFLELPVSEKYIVYAIPILSRRLAPQELIEPSEEVRLQCVSLLRVVVNKYKDTLVTYFDDLSAILCRTVTDNYPKVKKESCESISEIAKIMPRHFYAKSESFVDGILSNFTHQHQKVRVASVRTIGDVLLFGNGKLMEKVATPLAQRLFDQSGSVRAAVVEVAGKWLVDLRDRYSWWFKIIPLILTGLHDEMPEIRERAAELWDVAGRRYLEENETDDKIKDRMDFLCENLEHYPPNIKRPNLGCRIIVKRNLGLLMSGIAAELDDWLSDVKVRSAQLLCVLVFNAEQDATQHIEKLLPTMYRSCNDEDRRVVENVELAAEYMGYFVPPSTYCPLVLLSLEGNPTAGHLRVFASILKGSPRASLAPELEKIGHFLQQTCICQSRKPLYQKQILQCCESLVSTCKTDCAAISKYLFKAIFYVLSMSKESAIEQKAEFLLDRLISVEGLSERKELLMIHTRVILKEIENSGSACWTIYNPEFDVFQAIFVHAKCAVALNFDLILPILESTMCNDADPEVRLKQFILLAQYLENQDDLFALDTAPVNFVNSILDKTVFPALIWTAGRAAEAIRTASICCLCALLNKIYSETQKGESSKTQDTIEDFAGFFKKVVPVLATLMDDNARNTRLYSLRAVCLVMNIGGESKCVEEEHINSLYPVVLKRLDDGCDDVRCEAIEAIRGVWSAAPEDYNLEFNRAHVDMLYTTAIIHLDDPETVFQDLMLDALMDLGKVHPELLIRKIEKCRGNFRNQKGLDALLNRAKGFLKEN